MPAASAGDIFTRFESFAQQRFAGAQPFTIELTVGQATVHAPCLRVGNRLLVLLHLESDRDVALLLESLRSSPPPEFDQPQVFEVIIAVDIANALPPEGKVAGRGIRLSNIHEAIAAFVGLPAGWRSTQVALVEQALAAVRITDHFELADLYAVLSEDDRRVAQTWLRSLLSSWTPPETPAVYLQAEAGKGKSTLLAYATLQQLEAGTGPLPLYLPLRTLRRGEGVSWGEIAARLGVLGSVAEDLKVAIRTGLVTLVLDGLDEVAGRYDPTVVRAVTDVALSELGSPQSLVIISGRTTESLLLDSARSTRADIELPDSSEEAFEKYAGIVLRTITPLWPKLSARVPEPPADVSEFTGEAPTDRQIEQMLQWVRAVFDDVGKERSLFFVQSLACIARTHQLDGNKALIIWTAGKPKIAEVRLYDVCILAAALACVREQDKVEEIAKHSFTPEAQLQLLTAFSVRSSAEDHLANQLPTPGALAQDAFGIDTVNQTEEFTAVVRQMQKHALLFSGAGDSPRIGDWRPFFLSEWVRAAFLCRAWLRRGEIWDDKQEPIVRSAIVRAQRAKIAFTYLFPEFFEEDRVAARASLVESLCAESANGSPEASANYWAFMAGLEPLVREGIRDSPERINELSDLSELSFEGLIFGENFSANTAFFVATEFVNCEFTNCTFTSCDFGNALFTNCTFEGVGFRYCDGVATFDTCTFKDCVFENFRSAELPAITFDSCLFREGTSVIQTIAPGPKGVYDPVTNFSECLTVVRKEDLLQGEWLGLDMQRVRGISTENESSRTAAEVCLRALLKPFFPRRAGTGRQLQARRYIRSSAVGRGVLPQGSPSASELIGFLSAEGFTDGGREAHIYAPWAPVVGGGAEAIALRNEMLAFMLEDRRGPTVRRLLNRIDRAAAW